MAQTDASSPRARRVLLLLGIAAAAVAAAGLATGILARSVLDPDALADRIEPRLAAAVNRPVEVRDARLRLWPRPALELRGVRIENRAPFADAPLATIDAVALKPRLLPLLRRRIVVDRIDIRSPRVLLVAAGDGTTNYGDLVPESRTGDDDAAEGGQELSIDVRRIVLDDGRFGLVDRARGRTIRADGIEATARLRRAAAGDWETSGRVTLDSAGLVLPDLAPGSRAVSGIRFEWEGTAPPGFESLEIRRGALLAGSFRTAVAGRIDSLKSAVRRIDLALVADGLPLADLVGATERGSEMRAAGTLDVDLRVQGPLGPGRKPDVSGVVLAREARLAFEDAPAILSDLDAEVRLADGVATVRAAGGLADGTLAAEGTVRADSLLPLDLRVRAEFGLAALSAALPPRGAAAPERPAAEGRVDLAGRLTGPAGDPDELRLTGTAGLADIAVPVRSLTVPVRLPAASIRLAGREATWRDAEIRLGESVAWSTGVLRLPPGAGRRDAREQALPAVDMDFRSRHLDLAAIRPAPEEGEAGWGRLAFARLGDRRIGSRTATDIAAGREMRRPGAPPVRGTVVVRVDTLRSATQTLTGVTGTLRLGADRIDVEDVQFRAWGGSGTATGSLAVEDGPVQPFGLRLSLEGVRAEEWLGRHTPLGSAVQGTMNLDLELAGGLDTLLLPAETTLAGVGTAAIRDGAIGPNPLLAGLSSFLALPEGAGTRIRDWVSPFRIEQDRLVLSDARLRLQGFEADLAGAVGFGGGLDLGVLLRPDAAVGRGLAGGDGVALPAGIRDALGGGVPVELGLRIGGRLGSPSVSLDPGATTAGIQRRAQDAARQTLERTLEGALGRAAGDGPAPEDAEPGAEGEADAAAPPADPARELERQGLDLLRRLTGGPARDSAAPAATTPDTAPGAAQPE